MTRKKYENNSINSTEQLILKDKALEIQNNCTIENKSINNSLRDNLDLRSKLKFMKAEL